MVHCNLYHSRRPKEWNSRSQLPSQTGPRRECAEIGSSVPPSLGPVLQDPGFLAPVAKVSALIDLSE